MVAIFQSCLLPKMKLSVVLEGRYIGYLVVSELVFGSDEQDESNSYQYKIPSCYNL